MGVVISCSPENPQMSDPFTPTKNSRSCVKKKKAPPCFCSANSVIKCTLPPRHRCCLLLQPDRHNRGSYQGLSHWQHIYCGQEKSEGKPEVSQIMNLHHDITAVFFRWKAIKHSAVLIWFVWHLTFFLSQVSAVLVSFPAMGLCLVWLAHMELISLRWAAHPVSHVEEASQPNMKVQCHSRTVRLKVRIYHNIFEV